MRILSALILGMILTLFVTPLAPAFAGEGNPAAAQDGDGKKKGKKHQGKKKGHHGKKGHKKGKKPGKKGKKKGQS